MKFTCSAKFKMSKQYEFYMVIIQVAKDDKWIYNSQQRKKENIIERKRENKWEGIGRKIKWKQQQQQRKKKTKEANAQEILQL